MKHVAATIVSAIALLLLGAVSRLPFDSNRDNDAMLRFSWRTRGEAAEHCRNRTPEELAALPAHMRTPQVCEGRVANYRLDVELDDHHLPTHEFRAAGAHADRPIYVLREIRVAPGEHHLEARFYSTLQEHKKALEIEDSVSVRPGDIVLITYDDESGRLIVRREGSRDE